MVAGIIATILVASDADREHRESDPSSCCLTHP
jgi:hypothetical protein